MRSSLGHRFETDHGERIGHAPIALLGGDPPHPQCKRDIVGDAHMRPQCIGLKHHADSPLLRRQCKAGDAHDLVRQPDRAGIRFLEARHQAQQRGLAAAGRPQEREELTVRDRQRDILDGARRAELLRYAFQAHACHGTTPSGSLPRSVVASMARPSVSTTEIVATAAAAGELPSYCRANTTTPSVSRPVDHSSAETVSSLSALMKISNAPAMTDGATEGRITARSRSRSGAPAICAASSRFLWINPIAAIVGRSTKARKRARYAMRMIPIVP